MLCPADEEKPRLTGKALLHELQAVEGVHSITERVHVMLREISYAYTAIAVAKAACRSYYVHKQFQ